MRYTDNKGKTVPQITPSALTNDPLTFWSQ